MKPPVSLHLPISQTGDVPVSDHIMSSPDILASLRAGDQVLLNGVVYAARDAAHKRMAQAIEEAKSRGEAPEAALPFPVRGAAIYYMGPSPARPGQVIGSAGPTTSGRMDKYTPELLDLGVSVMIGKGRRSTEVNEAIVRNSCVYLGAVGGAGALLSKCIKESEIIAYEELGAEAIRRLVVKDFPAVVITDSTGICLYT